MMLEKIYIDMDGVMCDFLGRAIEVLGQELPPEDTPERKKMIDDCQLIKGFYYSLKPIDGAIEAYHALRSKYHVEILTAPSWDNPHSWGEKQQWCVKYLGDSVYKKLTQTHDKGQFTGRALIDDRIKYGVDRFNGEHIHFGTERFPNWDTVLKYLL
jgi:5'(3')-deoxyribonucleotidase